MEKINNMKEKIIKYLKIILILLILEVIFFNITSYRTFFGNFEKQEFLQLENPYDALNRDSDLINRDEDYLWDAAYYNGKFYVYFGILPVLVIFLPFYLITG